MESGALTKLPVRNPAGPKYSPDARTILFVRLDEGWRDHEVIAIDATTGGGARTIVRDTDFFDHQIGAEFGPAQVSPRGDLVLFRSHRSGWLNWWLVPLAGGEPRQLAAEAADQSSQKPFRGYAQWSPDGQHVLYTSNLNGTHVLRVAPAAGGERHTSVSLMARLWISRNEQKSAADVTPQ